MTGADSPVIDVHRALPVRCRRDLVFARRSTARRGMWTAKDPLSLKYYQLRQEELFVLQRLDGATSPAAIQSEFAHRFAPRKLDLAELLRFLHRLIDQGLAITCGAQPATLAVSRRQSRSRRARWSRLANPLVVRFRGVDPQPFLDRLYPAARWLLSPPCLLVYMLIITAALLLIGCQWDEFRHRLPATRGILGATSFIWLMLAIGIVKIMHELGHALVCRHFGGECRELGFMLLAFSPCLYCNVSDVWLLPNKWHRMAVSAAGIGVELTLAGICTFLWWFSEPGAFHSLCLSIMMVASLGTLFLNGNPLLRYDGYYILSDFLEAPNLRSRSMAALRRSASRLLFGVREPADEIVHPGLTAPLVLYGAASTLYLWTVIFVIVRFVYERLKPVGLEPLAVALAVIVIGGKVLGTGVTSTQRVRAWRAAGLIRPVRFGFGCLILSAAVAILLFIPFPFRVDAPCLLTAHDARGVFVTIAGYASFVDRTPHVEYGAPVAEGQPILKLVNHELEQDILRLQGERDRQASVVEVLRRRQFNDPAAAVQLPSAEAELRDSEKRWRQRVHDQEGLVVRAPSGGLLLPPPLPEQRPSDQLRREGRPLDARNQHAWFETGTVLGMVGRPDRFDALLAVDQANVSYLRAGQVVRMRLDQTSPQVVTGTITEIAARPLETAPPPLVVTRRLAARIDKDGAARPARTVYEVRVAIDENAGPLIVGAVGAARVEAGDMTLLERLLRVLKTTFVAQR